MIRALIPFLSLLFIGSPSVGLASSGDSLIEKRKDSVLALCKSLKEAQKDSARRKIGKELDSTVRSLLKREGIFQEKLPGISEHIGILYAPDRSFRLFNWNVAYTDGTHEYFAYILRKREGRPDPIRLDGKRGPSERNKKKGGGMRKGKLERMDLDPNEWIPALYYEIIKKERNGKPFYTLLGWEGKDQLTTRKTIEVLRFTKKGEPHFGLPVFKKKSEKKEEIETWREKEKERRQQVRRKGKPRKQRPKQRIIFEFTDDATMTLKYEAEKDRIVFNQLVPERPDLKGIYEFYGPDLFFNAYTWKEAGHWLFKKKVKPENKGGGGKPWNDPKEEE